jgi:hypothetical protein
MQRRSLEASGPEIPKKGDLGHLVTGKKPGHTIRTTGYNQLVVDFEEVGVSSKRLRAVIQSANSRSTNKSWLQISKVEGIGVAKSCQTMRASLGVQKKDRSQLNIPRIVQF